MESDELELEIDEHVHVFDDAGARQELQRQMSQLSPRRASVADASFATTTLPFYQDISPSTALEHMFDWFQSAPIAAGSSGASGTTPVAPDTIGLDEFNRLRKSLGKLLVGERDWNRALEELADRRTDGRVAKKNFKALFGPDPFFGSESVQGIVREVMKCEESLHFAQMLVNRFGVDAAGDERATAALATVAPSAPQKLVGLEQLQSIQRACCTDIAVFGDSEWSELMKKLQLAEGTRFLNWMQFTEVFTVSLKLSTTLTSIGAKSKRVFSPHTDPQSVVYAVLANDNVLATVKDPDEDNISRKAFTNLLRVRNEKVDDEVWLELLQNMQTTYNYRQQKMTRRNSATEADGSDAMHGHEQPLVIVRNTENQVLSYDIVFAELGDIGLTLQSDFYGHCLTVAAKDGPAALHSLIEKDDIVAAVNDVSLIYDLPAVNKEEEETRLARGKALLGDNSIRKVTFYRQESYFRFDPTSKAMTLFLKTIAQVPPDGTLIVKCPNGWKPVSERTDEFRLRFEIPQLPDFANATVTWDAASDSIRVALDGETGIAENSTLVFDVVGMDCGSDIVFGPCELSEGDLQYSEEASERVCFVSLYTNWRYRESSMRGNPIRDRSEEGSEYFDTSLRPLGKDFHAGDSGITIGSDFFGQCPVVTSVKKLSEASRLDVCPQDILSSIISFGAEGESMSLNQLTCIKPFAMSKSEAEKHLKDVRKQLAACHKSGRPYQLQFLRLNSFFFHDEGRTIFTFNALTTLQKGTSIIIKMPSAKWFAGGAVTARVLDPAAGVKVLETFWDSQMHSVRLVLDECMIAESTPVTVEMLGITFTAKRSGKLVADGAKLAGPGEVVGLKHGSVSKPPEMAFELHEHWHSFLVGHQGIEVSKVADTLKRFKTSPALLWKELEYTSRLFEMMKPIDSEVLSLTDLNRLIKIVCGDQHVMDTPAWNSLCRNLGAKPIAGLSRRQFACCWNDIIDRSNHQANDVYTHLDTAKNLFNEIVTVFQNGNDRDLIAHETIQRLAKVARFSESMTELANAQLDEQSRDGWDRDFFSQIICGGNTAVKFDDNGSTLLLEICYAKKLFAQFSVKDVLKKKALSELLAAAKILKPKLTNDLWSEVCDSVGLDDNGGLRLADFIEVYAGDLLGSRSALADFYRIETFKLLPERRVKETEVSKEAVMSVAPEKVNVKDVAAKALEETASAEELFQELRAQKLEFSKLEKTEEKTVTTFPFESELAAKHVSRERGFLHIQVRSITELADRMIQKNSSFNKDNTQAEELYVMFEVVDAAGLRFKVPPTKSKTLCDSVSEHLFGNHDKEVVYQVAPEEKWHGRSQKAMRALHDLDVELAAATPQTAEYDELVRKIKQVEESVRPAGVLSGEPFDGRVFSSLILRDPSPDALVRFPEDEFRVFIDYPDLEQKPKYVVCKLFKRIGSAKSRLQLELGFKQEALRKADITNAILKDLVEQQERHLRLTVAEEHASGKNAAGNNRIWTTVSKLKQKRQDLVEFELEAGKLRESVTTIQAQLDEILKEETPQEVPSADAAAASTEGDKAAVSGAASALAAVKANEAKNKERGDVVPDSEQVCFIGRAFFELRELLRVLHDDGEETEDLATFVTEHHKDVGVLLLHFQYKCEGIQSEADAAELPSLSIRMADNDSAMVAQAEEAFEYPSHAHLQLQWRAGALLKRGDRVCIVREGDPYKLAMPYFLLLWNKPSSSDPVAADGAPADDGAIVPVLDEETRVCDWRVPDMLKKFYGETREPIVSTDAMKQSGKLLFPSALGLSLPPGVYRIYLLRNETDASTDTNYRVTLGKTQPLAVLPGVNSVHTSFGTTPLIDVKPTSVSMLVFPEVNRSEMVEALTSTNGYYDPTYERQYALEQELEVTTRDLAIKQTVFDKAKVKKDDKKREIEELTRIVDKLKKELQQLTEEKGAKASPAQVVAVKSQPLITHSDPVVFSYRFHGGAPRNQDRIVVLPADIVHVTDVLRSTILGKLQSNDPGQVRAVRRILERELSEVAQLFDMSISLGALWRLIMRTVKKTLGIGSGAGLQDKSDAYMAATGADAGEFVLEECMKAYSGASPLARKYFPLIVRDLLEEVEARTALLGSADDDSSENAAHFQTGRLAKAGALMQVGLELPVNASKSGEPHSEVSGEQSVVLGRAFYGGGMYVAKYVRRVDDANRSSLSKPGETAGELCRFGPFYVEPAVFQISFWQVLWVVKKLVTKVVESDQGKLAIKICSHWVLAAFKCLLAIISLSFNLSVLAGDFNLNTDELNQLLTAFKAKMSDFFGPVEVVLGTIYTFFDSFLQDLMDKLDIFDAAGECYSGFFLYAVLVFLIAATFVVYVVVQEDLLLKVQKLDTYLPFHPGKAALGVLEQVGALLVIPLYLVIKSCVLFISRHWRLFFANMILGIPSSFESFQLYTETNAVCPDVTLARVNYGFGVFAVALIIAYLFVCLPLLLLDLYSWVPLTELEDKKKLHELAHSMARSDIGAAIHSNADLVEVPKACRSSRCLKPGMFQRHYDDYTTMSFRELQKSYGLVRLLAIFIHIYLVLMAKSIGRGLGVLLGWRPRGGYMYRSAVMKPGSKWRVVDAFCLRFNLTWKLQYVKRKIILPFVNIVLVTFGLWGEMQWKEFNVEERANDCYKMEPSGEIKQLQMMTLHGKIVSLFWLCVPDTLILAYLSEVLNRGPIFSYFLNKKFLQADIPESEREKDPVWRFHSLLRFSGEEDVVYLSDTRFYSTVIKWGSSMVEIVSLFSVYGSGNKSPLLGIALISSVVAPVLELNQQIIKAYVDYVETVEHLAKATGVTSAFKAASDAYDKAADMTDDAPGLTINTAALARKRAARKKRAAAAKAAATNGPAAAIPDDATGDTALNMLGPSVQLGTSSTAGNLADKAKEQASEAQKEVIDSDVAAAATMEAVQALVPKKELVVLNALPQVTYVVLTDALDVGEGEITVSWNVNARQRFHALDAIGMFPARAPGDMSLRTMDQCICYRLLKDVSTEAFGWKARKQDDEEFDRQLMLSRAESLRNFTQKSIRLMDRRIAGTDAHEEDEGEERMEAAKQRREEQLEKASATISGMLESPKLKPYKKKMREILEDEVAENKLQQSLPRAVRLMSRGANSLEEAAKKMRKVVNGQVKFRPANNSVGVDHPQYEAFVYGNDAGIYQPKYGLQSYEFCYLRRPDTDVKVVGLGGKPEAKPNAKVLPTGGQGGGGQGGESHSAYEILDRFSSNEIKIGTFNLFMNLTCDVPLLGPGEKLNLSWIIYGVDYSILSNPKCRNCIAFYRIESSAADPRPPAGPAATVRARKASLWGSKPSQAKAADGHKALVTPDPSAEAASARRRPAALSGCAKIESIPTSAYLEVEENEPCPGRMSVTAPSEPGMYEVRFLFNFFKKAQLHRQCQVFGELEDQMQELRIRSFYEKRAVTEELRKLALREPKRWGLARMNTFAWLKSMLLSTLREPVADATKESTSEYGEFLLGRLKRKLQRGLQSPSRVFQQRLALMVAPLQRSAFMDVLLVALSSSAQAADQLASVTFAVPTEEDEKRAGLNQFRDRWLLPTDRRVLLAGARGFRLLALNYLRQPSLCGFHDLVDDVVLTHAQLLKTVDQVMKDLSSSCVALYESAIARAVEAMRAEADAMGLKNVLHGVDVLLEDLCRNHLQSVVRAFLETDCRSGLRWKGPPKGTLERLNALRASTTLPSAADDGFLPAADDLGAPADLTAAADNQADNQADSQVVAVHGAESLVPPRDSRTPVTRQHIAVRRWIFPRLTRQLMGGFRQRYARMMSGNLPIAMDLARAATSCLHPGLALAGNPFPNHREMRTESPLHFMGEARASRPAAGDRKDPEDELDDELFRAQDADALATNADAIDDSEADASFGADGGDDDDDNQEDD